MQVPATLPLPAVCPGAIAIGFGRNLRCAWENHVATSAGRRDLRFNPQPPKSLPLIEQFEKMPMGDVWEEARLWGPLQYMLTSKRLRTGFGSKDH